jgi:hypothetical protein
VLSAPPYGRRWPSPSTTAQLTTSSPSATQYYPQSQAAFDRVPQQGAPQTSRQRRHRECLQLEGLPPDRFSRWRLGRETLALRPPAARLFLRASLAMGHRLASRKLVEAQLGVNLTHHSAQFRAHLKKVVNFSDLRSFLLHRAPASGFLVALRQA